MTTSSATPERDVRVERVDPVRDRLRPVTGRVPLRNYLEQLWGRRDFILADARGRVRSSNRDTRLGVAWLVLRPLLDGAAFFVIFALLLEVHRGIEDYIGYLLVGVFLFSFTSRSLSSGASSLIAGRPLLRAFSFPRAALPVAVVLREALTFVPVVGVLLVLVLLLPPHGNVTWRWALLPLVLAGQALFNLGIALVAARATAWLPDLTHLISLFTRFWLYGSAVFFSFDRYVSSEGLLALLQANPAFVVLDMTRDLLLYARVPSPGSWALLLLWAAGALAVGTVVFWRGEEGYGRV